MPDNNSEGLPEMEWDGKFTVSHKKGEYEFNKNMIAYTVTLGDGWKTDDDYDTGTHFSTYIDGAMIGEAKTTSEGRVSDNGFTYEFNILDLSSKPRNVTYKINQLKHYSNGNVDGVAKNVEISFATEVESVDSNYQQERPYYIPTHLVYDGTQDLVFKLNAGTGDWAIKEIEGIWFAQTEGYAYYITDFNYDAETGEINVPYYALNEAISQRGGTYRQNMLYLDIRGTYQNGKTIRSTYGDEGYEDEQKFGLSSDNGWSVEVVTGNWSANGDMPEFINTSYEFDGTQDMVFNFKNGTGDNAIKVVKEVLFPVQEANATDENGMLLRHFRIANYGTSFNYDIEKGQVTLYKHAVSAIVYGGGKAVSNVYGGGYMIVELANGQTRTLYVRDGDANWSVKILEKSSNATGQHRIPAKEGGYTVEDMQILVNINKDHDVVIYTPEGVVFTFAKGTMRMIDGKDNYPFGVEIIADFSKSGITYKGVTSDIFACRINFEYSGELPGTPKVSIPVDNKWNGQTLYYYQVGGNGETLLNTEKSAVVENGLFEVMQGHCSDYVILSKSPKELGVTGTADIGNGNNGNTSTQGSTNTASENNATPQFKPVNTNAAPRTGDAAMVLLFIVLCGGACIVGIPALKAKRRTR